MDLIASGYKEIQKADLNEDEKLALQDTVQIKRLTEKFWGM